MWELQKKYILINGLYRSYTANWPSYQRILHDWVE